MDPNHASSSRMFKPSYAELFGPETTTQDKACSSLHGAPVYPLGLYTESSIQRRARIRSAWTSGIVFASRPVVTLSSAV
jgi:hypothetical protein